MSIETIRSLGSINPSRIYQGLETTPDRKSFAETLQNAVAEVNELQARRDDMVAGMVAGEPVEVHDVMAAAKEAQLAFELLLEVRNRLLESYQEIMKMQV